MANLATKENAQQLAGAPATNDIVLANLPDLSKAEAAPVELLGEYWTPVKPGETKRVFFIDTVVTSSIDPASGEDVELTSVRFLDKKGDAYRTIRNSSKRLVAAFEVFSGDIKGQPFEITYIGKERNTTNSFMSDRWSVRPLIVK